MRILQIGNGSPPFSTENDVHLALKDNGHDVVFLQEDDFEGWVKAIVDIGSDRYDLVIWTRTKSLADKIGHELQRHLQYAANVAGIKVIGYHLDRWWGLKREWEVLTEPWFRNTVCVTADGHHEAQWGHAGVEHRWMLPAVSERWVRRYEPSPSHACDVLFVGNWQGGYHEEWQHRPRLIKELRRRYGRRLKLLPEPGQPAVRGDELGTYCASAKIVVGDSCLVPGVDGEPMTRYCSDRVPETLGRGGLLLHPDVEGVTYGDGFLTEYAPFNRGVDLLTWELGDWDEMHAKIEMVLEEPEAFDHIREAGREHVRQEHTYTVRMKDLIREWV